MPSRHPFQLAFWKEEVDARPLALLRIGLGLVVLTDWLDRLRDFHAFYTAPGLVPNEFVIASRAWRFSLLDGARTPLQVGVWFALGILASIALTCGWRTRLATVASWLLVQSVQERNILVCDSGDTVVRVLLIWGSFIDLGAVWSVDTLRGLRQRRPRIPALPVRLLQLQVAIIYCFAFLAKSGSLWRDGSAIYYALQTGDFTRPFGAVIARSPFLCRVLTRATLLVEGLFLPLVCSPVRPRLTRATALLGGLGLHAGIFLTMRVGVFSIVMPVSYLAFVEPEWLDAVLARLPSVSWLERYRRAAIARSGSLRLPVAPVHALLLCSFALVLYERTAAELARPVPTVAQAFLGYSGLWQDWHIFSPDPPYTYERWQAPGVLTDGTQLDVLERAAPHMRPSPGFFYSRWYKWRSNLQQDQAAPLKLMGAYLCRRYNTRAAGPRLSSFDLILHARSIAPPGQPPLDEKSWTFLHQSCAEAP